MFLAFISHMENGKTLREKVRRVEEAEITEALNNNGWIKAKAARTLGITERMIGYKIRKYGIKRDIITGPEGSTPQISALALKLK